MRFFQRRPSNLTHHFIHIPKNAGRSIRKALGHRVSTTDPFHYRFRDIETELQPFAVIRNPWSRTVSRYAFLKKSSLNWPESDERRIYIHSVSFSEFVREQRALDIPEWPGQPWMGPIGWMNQLEWVIDHESRVVCDCLRFECIDQDLCDYFRRSIRLPKGSNKRKSDYRHAYTDDLIEIVGQAYHADIDYFGFTFDGPGTRGFYGS